jgi:hypothetical protein
VRDGVIDFDVIAPLRDDDAPDALPGGRLVD